MWTVLRSPRVPTEVVDEVGVITRKRTCTCSFAKVVPECLPQVTYTFPFAGEIVRWLSCTKSRAEPVPRVASSATGAVQVERLLVHLAIRMAEVEVPVAQEKRVHTT